MTRVHNFSAGPAALPLEVLQQAREEMLDWRGSGMSIMEMSHRSKEFVSVAETAESNLRELMAIPDDYAVLFLQGGASLQFSMVPMNLSQPGDRVDFLYTGQWGKKAIAEAKKFCDVHLAASSEDDGFCSVPAVDQWQLSDSASYVHYTENETIGGVQFHSIPEVGGKPLVCDMSSSILSRPIDVSRFGVIYAGAQKNIGPAGLTVVIVKKELIGKAREGTPSMLDYQVHAGADSMSNTPPTYGWYLSGLVFEWLKKNGGVEAIAKINARKASKLYAAIDDSDFYRNPVAIDSRSLMNVPFILADQSLDKLFLEKAEAAGLMNLKGHRAVGGMRASIYNAVTEESVDALIAFMRHFEKTKG